MLDTKAWLGLPIVTVVTILVSTSSLVALNILFKRQLTSDGRLSLGSFNSFILLLSALLAVSSYVPSGLFTLVIVLVFCLLWQVSFMVLVSAAVAGKEF